MRALALSVAISTSLFVGTAGAVDRLISGFPDLPSDARKVAERSLACQHFWGEINGTGDERDKDVASQLKRLRCNDIARDLDQIRAKYGKNPSVLKILQEAALAGVAK